MKKLILSTIALLIILITSCDSPTEVIDDSHPGRRDYVWTVDTIKVDASGYLTPLRIWGSSPKNIWLTCSSDRPKYNLWHYDGSWEIDAVHYFFSIYGFTENQVWASNSNGEFWFFNGISWNLSSKISIEGADFVSSNNIWGNTPNNIFSVGSREKRNVIGRIGTIIKYNGTNWTNLNIPDNPYIFLDIRSFNFTFVTAYNIDSGTKPYSLFILNDSTLTTIYEGPKPIVLSSMKDQCYFIQQSKIYKYEGGELRIWKDFSSTNFIARLWGRNENDFFTYNYDGIGHFNGADLKTIFNTNAVLRDAVIFSNDVFFIAQGASNNTLLVIHGKLN